MNHLRNFPREVIRDFGNRRGVAGTEGFALGQVRKRQAAHRQIALDGLEQIGPRYPPVAASTDDALVRRMAWVVNLANREQVRQFNAKRGDNIVNTASAVAVDENTTIVAFANRQTSRSVTMPMVRGRARRQPSARAGSLHAVQTVENGIDW